MRKRYQRGALRQVGGSWQGQWWEDGHRRTKTLGKVGVDSKSSARAQLDAILIPINGENFDISSQSTLGHFISDTYLPFYLRKWKKSTASTNTDRVKHHIVGAFGDRVVSSFDRNELQDFLDERADKGLSRSYVDHLRWDLSQIFEMIVQEGLLERNPAKLLFVPKSARQFEKRRMTIREVKKTYSILESRERLIAMLAITCGMRPGEIFGLQWRHEKTDHLEIRQRDYRGDIDTPKTRYSVRRVALSAQLQAEFEKWKGMSLRTGAEGWVFPSENLRTRLNPGNCWRRNIAPRLRDVGLEWANFQVMRRTHCSLMNKLAVDPKVVSDQIGNSVDVNLNVYRKPLWSNANGRSTRLNPNWEIP